MLQRLRGGGSLPRSFLLHIFTIYKGMERIVLDRVLPAVFAAAPPEGSQVWLADVGFGRGEVCLVESASGGGKSSLCGYLYGYRRDYQGVIRFDGRDIRELRRGEWSRLRRTELAVMMQDLRLFPELTAMENVLLKNNLTRSMTRAQIDGLFEALGIGEKRDAPVGRLSFGQQQRVAFVRTLCQRADFLLLDEPVSHLDDRNAATMARILAEHVRASGAGVVVTSIGKHFDIPYDKTFAL
jgi:ABC-type lipoprotein export system ATPase subunit